MAYDYTLVMNEQGFVIAHKPDCPDVGKAREAGAPLLTMLDCEKPLGMAYRRHSCLPELKKSGVEKDNAGTDDDA